MLNRLSVIIEASAIITVGSDIQTCPLGTKRYHEGLVRNGGDIGGGKRELSIDVVGSVRNRL